MGSVMPQERARYVDVQPYLRRYRRKQADRSHADLLSIEGMTWNRAEKMATHSRWQPVNDPDHAIDIAHIMDVLQPNTPSDFAGAGGGTTTHSESARQQRGGTPPDHPLRAEADDKML